MKKLCAITVAGLLVISAILVATAASGNASPYPNSDNVFNVLDYGAKADDNADDTEAFQKALDAAAATKGTVLASGGSFHFNGVLTVPEGVTLMGGNVSPYAGLTRFQLSKDSDTYNNPETAFITLKANSVLHDIQINYPDQKNGSNGTPEPYGWSVRLNGANVQVRNLYTNNAYQFIDVVSAPGHVVEKVNAWSYKIGVRVDKCDGEGLLKDIHLWPFDGSNNEWVRDEGIGFLLGYAKKETIEGCFTIRYGNPAYQFKDLGNGAGHYTMLTSGADCTTGGMVVDNVGSLTVKGGQFMHAISIESTNRGPVTLINCGFWEWESKSTYQIQAKGTGKVTVDPCHFNGWGSLEDGSYAVVIDGPEAEINSCDFAADKNHIQITANTQKASVLNTLFKGGIHIDNQSKGAVLKDNLAYSVKTSTAE